MEGWVIAVITIVALLMAGIAGLVGYLLYRPSPKKDKMKPEGPISTKYPESPENGDVKVNIPDETNGTTLPPYASKESLTNGRPAETKVLVEDNSDKDSSPDKDAEDPLLEVKVEPQERAVDVGSLEKRAPKTPTTSIDENKDKPITDKDKSSFSSDSENDKGEQGQRRDFKDKDSSSTSSSSDHVKPMPLIDPHIVSEPKAAKRKNKDDIITKCPSDSDIDSDLVNDVMAAVDAQKKDSKDHSSSDEKRNKVQPKDKGPSRFSSSSSSDDEKKLGLVPAVRHKRKDDKPESKDGDADKHKQTPKPVSRKKKSKTKQKSSSSSSSTDSELDVRVAEHGDIGTQTSVLTPKKRSKPRKKSKKTPSKTPTSPVATQTTPLSSSSTSSESKEDDERLVKISPIYATPKRPKKSADTSDKTTLPKPSSTSSSSSSEEGELELHKLPKEEISTQTSLSLSKKKKRHKIPKPSEFKTTSTTASGSKTSSSSSSSSDIDEEDLTMLEIARRHIASPVIARQGPRPWSPPAEVDISHDSPQLDRSTQTLVAPKTKTPGKKKKPKEPKSATKTIVIYVADKMTQTEKTSSSSSSSSDDKATVKPKRIHVYEKTPDKAPFEHNKHKRPKTERKVVVSSTDKRAMVSTGTGTESPTTTKKVVTSSMKHKHAPLKTISLELEGEEHYKTEAMVKIPKKSREITFTSSWGKPVKLEDLHEAGIVDDDIKNKLEAGKLDPNNKKVMGLIRPYISSNQPVGGILLPNGEKISIYEASRRGLLLRGYAINLLEAQAATGCLVDPSTGEQMSVTEGAKRGLINNTYEAVVGRSERAVYGYKTRAGQQTESVYEAMNRNLIVSSHGFRLLEAQIATGGIIDPRKNLRLPLKEAYKRKLLDKDIVSDIENPTSKKKGYVDPATTENVTYKELMSRCVVDKDTGVLLLPMEKGGTSTSFVTSSEKSSKSSHSTQTEKFSSSDSSGKGKKKKQLKTSTAQIELVKTPIMSADDEDSHGKTDENRKREISEIAVKLDEAHPTYQPITINLTTEDTSDKKSPSTSSSEDEDDGETKTKRRRKKDKSSSNEYTTTTTVVTTTETIMERKDRKRSRHEIKFKSGWDRRASLVDLLSAGVISEKTVNELEEGTIQEEDVATHLQQYLVGEEPIAGLLISETGENMSIYSAWRKGIIRRGTSVSLLEAQAATGRILDPKTGERMSVSDSSRKGLIDRQFETVLVRAERAVYGYTTRLSTQRISLFQAMKRGLVVENHGIRLLEAQIATGGIIDPNANHRLPVEVAYERGLFDKRMNDILEDPSDDTRGFFDPNTEENLTYLELMGRCVIDKDTGMRLLPLRVHKTTTTTPQKSKVFFKSLQGRQVTLQDLINAEVVDAKTANQIDADEIGHDEKEQLVAKLRVFVDGTMPIAGVINTATGERISFSDATQCGLIRRGTAFELLEAQSCCDKIIDVQTGRIVTIETALRIGVIASEFRDVVERAHRAVAGYREPFKREVLSLCEAINRHLLVRRHGIRLLEAQIATGGIIDIRSPVRINVQVALKRALIDSMLADELEQRRTKSYFDPVTGENLNYSELMGRCVKDQDTGLLYLMVEGGTVTEYVRPFEPEHTSKIRSKSMSPGKLTTEEVATKESRKKAMSFTESSSTTESHTSVTTSSKKSKKKSKSGSRMSTTSVSSYSSEPRSPSSVPSSPPAILSRRVVIVDPNTDEELTVQEALRRKLIDKATAKQLMEQQGDFEEEAY